ncbi:hypothetical protein C3E77_08000 [Mycetocola zhujimingii]|nr:hypothetical protein C3E77_08000 [Mycetocola zhujimingii]
MSVSAPGQNAWSNTISAIEQPMMSGATAQEVIAILRCFLSALAASIATSGGQDLSSQDFFSVHMAPTANEIDAATIRRAPGIADQGFENIQPPATARTIDATIVMMPVARGLMA